MKIFTLKEYQIYFEISLCKTNALKFDHMENFGGEKHGSICNSFYFSWNKREYTHIHTTPTFSRYFIKILHNSNVMGLSQTEKLK